ncbi:MAG: TonB family protein [Prevotellaceae bacterium]|jgi:TonB family protein|nr:TonB family protein [Prevotellaceae bacterium]
MELLLYLIKVNLAIALLYGLYRLLFQGDTFFRCKRFILLSIPIIALLYPLPTISDRVLSPEMIASGSALPVYYLNEITIFPDSTPLSAPFWDREEMLHVAIVAYFIGALFFLLRLILQAVSTLSLVQKTNPVVLHGRKIHALKGAPAPFTFFTRIILDPEKYSESELSEILLHEEAHMRQKHFFDLMLAEVATALCWLNPFVRLLKKEIRINLEYLADQAVLQSGCEAKRYQLHLLRISYAKATRKLANNFNVSPLKKRIIMMNRKKTSPVSVWKYALLAPAFAFLAFFNESLKAEIHLPAPAADAIGKAAPADENRQGSAPAEKAKQDTSPKPTVVITSIHVDRALTKEEKGATSTPSITITARKEVKKDATTKETSTPPTMHDDESSFYILGEGATKDEPSFYILKEGATKKVVYRTVNEEPKFPNGNNALLQYFRENIKYPRTAFSDGIQGRVVAHFIVTDSGKIENAEIIRSLHPDCDAEVIRIIEAMPAWIPGKEKGKPVNVYFTLPITFRLE